MRSQDRLTESHNLCGNAQTWLHTEITWRASELLMPGPAVQVSGEIGPKDCLVIKSWKSSPGELNVQSKLRCTGGTWEAMCLVSISGGH